VDDSGTEGRSKISARVLSLSVLRQHHLHNSTSYPSDIFMTRLYVLQTASSSSVLCLLLQCLLEIFELLAKQKDGHDAPAPDAAIVTHDRRAVCACEA
jgi:hypothetical protein